MNQSLISTRLLSLLVAIGVPSCAIYEKPCEEVTISAEQVQQCQLLQRQISSAKGKPIIRTELERRYQQDCVELRYYRDDKQVEICGNKGNMKQVEQALKKDGK